MIWLLDISVQSCFIGKFAKDAWVLCTFSYAPIPSESPRSNRPVKSRALPGTWQGYFRKSTTLSLCELEMLRWGTWHRMGSTWFNYKGLCQSYAGEHIYIYYIYIYISIYIYIYRVCVVVSRAIWKGHLRSVWVAGSVVTGARGAQEFIPEWALICAVHKLFLSSIKASKANIAMAHPLSHQQTFPHFFLFSGPGSSTAPTLHPMRYILMITHTCSHRIKHILHIHTLYLFTIGTSWSVSSVQKPNRWLYACRHWATCTQMCVYIYTQYIYACTDYICIYSILCISTSHLHNLHNLPSEAMTSSLKLPKFHSFRDSMRGRRDEGGNWSGDS